MHRQVFLALLVLLVLSLVPVGSPTPTQAARPATVTGAPPLPRSCIRGAPLDSFVEAICCVSGYVYLNGTPVADAEVTISIAGRTLTTQTQSGPDSSRPYFAANLNVDPLNAQPGDAVTITASASGQTRSVTFTAQEGGQQIDVVLPQSSVEAAWTRGEIQGRDSHAMAYDATRQRIVLFGGNSGNERLDDTWEWDGITWIQHIIPIAPAPRYYHAMAYDAARQRIVLFGGGDNSYDELDDTWEWDGTTWTKRTSSASPSARTGHAMVYDAARQRIVLFGGDDGRNRLNDIWEWDGINWIERSPTISPPARSSHAMAYDTMRQRVVLFGGYSGNTLNDTWEWDGTTWTQHTPPNVPTARSEHTMAYDAGRQRVVLFGGNRLNSRLNDTWEWNGTTWTQRTPPTVPTARSDHAMAYDMARQRIVLFGRNETWEWDGLIWSRRLPPATSHALWSHAIAYDSTRHVTILFGGYNSTESTWVWNGSKWNEKMSSSTPPKRSSHAMVYDAGRQRVVLFGGEGNNNLNDTWEWDGTTWIKRTPSTAPPARKSHAMSYDAARQRVVLFGGMDDNSNSLNDTWEWDGTTWIQRTSPTMPSARFDHAMTYDAARQRIVLFGGFRGYSLSNETWEWDGTTWTQRTPPTVPASRYAHAMTYDHHLQRVVLFGGYKSGTLNDMWEWDGTTWTRRTPLISPGHRWYHAMAYDMARQRVVLVGGRDGGTRDTWEWDGTHWQLLMSDTFTQPGVRTNAALSFENTNTSLLFGGRDGIRLKNDTYRWDRTGWRQVTPLSLPPAARHGHRLARNSDGSRLLMFGGLGTGGTYLDDTWIWDSINDDWFAQSPGSHPSARALYGLTYDQNRNVWVLFGGQNGSSYMDDTWEYNGTTWMQRTPSTSPPARSNTTLTYDPVRGRAVLVGGQNSTGYLDDVWEWDGSNWAHVTPAQRLAARSGHGAAYDSSRNVIVVAGGAGTNGERNDTWEWNGSFWRQRTTAPELPAMYNLAMDYDAAHDRMVVFGGENSNGAVEGIFLHQVLGTPTEAPPVATINRILPRDARQGGEPITFAGSGADADSSNVIAAYRWSHNGTVISTQPTFTRPATDFPLGPQTIRLEVQDDEGDWSPAVEQQIYIRDGSAGVAGDKTWTLLIYAAADNNLDPWMGENAALNGMLYRLQNAGAQANVQVGMLYDGPGANDTRRYTLAADGAWTRTSRPEAQMDAMETLRDFILWGRNSLPPTDYYALAIVDHANGIVGIGQDETSKSAGNNRPFLTPLEVRAALQAATDDGAHKIDVLHYDGCSFGLFENAAIADDLAHFVIASPNTGWGVFAYDRYRQLAGSAADPRAYAVAVARQYAEAVNAQALPYTIAVFDLAHFDTLNAAISDLGQSLLTYVQADANQRRAALKLLRTGMQKYDSGQGVPFEPDNEDSYVDLIDLAQTVKRGIDDPSVQAAADAVIAQALPENQRFVIFEQHASHTFTYVDPHQGGERTYTVQLDNAHGLGLYYPPRSSTNSSSAYVTYVEHRLFHITRDSGWTRFIGQALPPQLSGDPPPLANDTLMPPFIPPVLTDPEQPDPPSGTQRIFLPLVVR